MSKNITTWKKVLLELYNTEPQSEFYSKGKTGQLLEGHPLSIKLQITTYQLDSALRFLEKHKFIEQEKGDISFFHLTDEGLRAAREIEQHNAGLKTQIAIGVFTAMLVFIGAAELLIQLNTSSMNLSVKIGYMMLYLVFFAAISIVIKNKFA